MLPVLASVRGVLVNVSVSANVSVNASVNARDVLVSAREIKKEDLIMQIMERIKRKVVWTVEKWNTEDFKAGKKPYEIMEFQIGRASCRERV